ncbi:MAG: LLM class flavin-dependent oxidoreductase [Candidatus Thorarchaeota archaeon]
MEWGIAINLREPVSEIVEKAVEADQGGIDTVWVTDFPATRLSPVLASLIAHNTKNCRIGVGLLSPLIYAPSHILQMMTTLIEMHGERFDLLLGPGDRPKLRDIGIEYGEISTIVERMCDSVTIIREGLWKYDVTRVFLGAQGQKMIKASTCSNGVLLNYSDTEMIQWAISTLGEKPQGFKIGAFPPSLIGSSKKCDEHPGIKTSAAVVALSASPSILKKFGLKEKLRPAIEKIKKYGLTQDVVEMIDQTILDKFSLCGSVDENSEQLTDFQRVGIDMIVFGPPQGASLRGVRNLAEAKKHYDSSMT